MAKPEVQGNDSALNRSRTCQCGCRTDISHLRANARYATPACRTRAWKDRTAYSDQRARKASPRRNSSSRSGRQVSYKRATTTLADWITLNWPAATNPHAIAEHVLRQALPARQRDHEPSVP